MNHPFLAAVANELTERNVATLRYQFPYMEAGGKRPDLPQIAQATVRAAVSAMRKKLPDISLIAGGLLTLAQNGGMVFGELAPNVFGAAFCNGTGVSRGTAFGKAVAEMATGKTSPIIDILKPGQLPVAPIPASLLPLA